MKVTCFFVASFLFAQAFDVCNAQTSASKSSKPVFTVFYGRDMPNLDYPENAKVEEGNLVDQRKEGYWSRYYEDGLSLKQKGEYENNRPNGHYSKYFQKGVLKEEGVFRNGKYVDSLKRFWDNGKLAYEAVFNENGKENGIVNYYYKSGKLEYTYLATDGKLSVQQRFNEDGTILDLRADREITIVETDLFLKKISAPNLLTEEVPNTFKANEYNKIMRQELIYQEGLFKNGQLFDGHCYIYDEAKQLIKIEIYKQGFLHSYGQI